MLNDLTPQAHQVLATDKGYRSTALEADLAAAGITMLRPAARITQHILALTTTIWHNDLTNNPVLPSPTPYDPNPPPGNQSSRAQEADGSDLGAGSTSRISGPECRDIRFFQPTPAKVGRRIVPIVSPCAGHERHPLTQSGIQGRWARWYFADGRDGGDAAPRRSPYVD